MTIPSKVISKANREALAKALATIAMKDQFVVIRSHLIKASDAALPLYNQVMDEIESASSIMRQFVSCRTADDLDLSEDYRYPLRGIKNRTCSEYRMPNWVDEALNNNDVNYPRTRLEIGDAESRPDWLEDLWAEAKKKIHGRYYIFAYYKLENLQVFSNRYVDLRYGDYIRMTKTQCSMIRGTIEELIKANIHADWLHEAYRKLADEIEQNVTEARTTKNLVEAWPECEPLLDYMYPSGSTSKVEVPLGNIVLRHVKALPSPQEAA